ncbi:phage tail protein [Tateyamaria sp. syn59]|uniref:phage tail protein n=1 Tax=Tateyamaria sp. syn59 TaxID=2576942 RepID=UPI0011BEF698|nr:tail fiber protein [Tateyamaria sp. syn59]
MKFVSKLACLPVSLALVAGATLMPERASAQQAMLGEVRMFGFNFCPRGWAALDGQILPINQNQSLYSILGTAFGGDGRTSFGLPDLRGRLVAAPSSSTRVGLRGGTETTTMTAAQLPSHTHTVFATNLDGDKGGPRDKILGASRINGVGEETIYSDTPTPNKFMDSRMIASSGAGAPIQIGDPRLAVTHCIATTGIFPSRN